MLSDYLRGIDVLSFAVAELAQLPSRSDEQVRDAPLPQRSLR